jgi:hypothetical protein
MSRHIAVVLVTYERDEPLPAKDWSQLMGFALDRGVDRALNVDVSSITATHLPSKETE